MRIALLDSGLRDESGHHANFARLIRAEAARRGWTLEIVAHKAVSPALQKALDARPHFSVSPYDRASSDPVCGDIETFIGVNALYRRELDAAGAAEADLVLIPTITHNQLYGLAQWLQVSARRTSIACAPMLMFPPGWEPVATRLGIDAALYRFGLKQFRGLGPDRLFLHAETGPVARIFTRLADRDVAVVPWPAAEDGGNAAASRRAPFSRRAPTIGYFGYGKAERGIFLLPEVLAAIAVARPDARFVVQVNSFVASETAGVADALRPLNDRVAIIEGALPRDRLMALMADCDTVLMPYDPEPYRERGSGLFGEAIMLGRTIVVPAGTWMAEELEAHGLPGVAFDRFEAASVAAATLDLIDRGAGIAASAAAAVDAWVGERTARTYLDAVTASLRGDGLTPAQPFPPA